MTRLCRHHDPVFPEAVCSRHCCVHFKDGESEVREIGVVCHSSLVGHGQSEAWTWVSDVESHAAACPPLPGQGSPWGGGPVHVLPGSRLALLPVQLRGVWAFTSRGGRSVSQPAG